MKRRTQVDATPCFLPMFLLFGGLAANRGARARRYGYPGYGAPGFGMPYGAMPGNGYPPQMYGGYGGAPTHPSLYSPWAIQHPQIGAQPGMPVNRPLPY
ncbi:hypothetical protein [Alicyclobacillus fodiniaquatilis]|jgi:hypothetical protein|uniref:Uncharacterized protein n=1 Tax=Alicyclobacillus fodiniaquatilis TaxID=1661150 RepID=A0ABW4JKA8_9BACL